ncbi:MAG: hypothetical protein HC888_04105 [Candidatus Competibacteraceae bacterium]|nr:hypothetical protein [Candidatus Competibacteraceae bacterium]
MAVIADSGQRGGLLVIFDYPSSLSRKFKRHLLAEEQKLFQTLMTQFYPGMPVYLTFAVQDFDSTAKKPNGEEMMRDYDRLIQTIHKVEPKKILCMGATAHAVLHRTWRAEYIPNIRGRLTEYITRDDDGNLFRIPTLTTYPLYFVLTGDSDQFRDLAFDLDKLSRLDKAYELPEIRQQVISTPIEAVQILETLSSASLLTCDIETTGLDWMKDTIDLVGFCAMTRENVARTFILTRPTLNDSRVRHRLFQLLNGDLSPTRVVFHNSKFDLKFLARLCGKFPAAGNIRDTILMNHLLDERPVNSSSKPHGLKSLARTRFDADNYAFDFEGYWEVKASGIFNRSNVSKRRCRSTSL